MLNSQARVFPTMLFFPALVWLGSYCWPYEHSCKILYKKKYYCCLHIGPCLQSIQPLLWSIYPWLLVVCFINVDDWIENHQPEMNKSNPKEKMIQSTIVDHQSTIHQSCMTSPQTLFMRSYDPVCINISVMSPLYI